MRPSLPSLFACAVLLGSGVASAASTTAQDVQRDAKKAGETSGRYLDERRQQVEASLQEKLDQIGKQLQELKARASKQTDGARQKLDRRIHSLEGDRQNLEKQLQALKDSSAAAWSRLRAGLQRAVDDLEQAVKGSAPKKVHRL